LPRAGVTLNLSNNSPTRENFLLVAKGADYMSRAGSVEGLGLSAEIGLFSPVLHEAG